MTRVHLKRAAYDPFALCGIRPRGSFKLVLDVSKFTRPERESVCKVCLKAANGIEHGSSSATSGQAWR